MATLVPQTNKVICYVNPQNMKPVLIKEGGVLSNKYGVFAHNDMLGKPFGSKMASINQRGFIHLLFPTPELWTLNVPHRTQILYHPDISLIIIFLELRPGVDMLECGTGSGSFSHSICRTIAPTGHLYSFEYHAERFEKAKVEFKEHGLDHVVTVAHRDVCKDGFDLTEKVTAVFLDLPSPWEALESAVLAFKKDRVGRICTFSPCIEQVQLTCTKLKECGFTGLIV
jgi:tRNA (adenine57-N1/adenine58-N1)-methyltransferase catalytic subunit